MTDATNQEGLDLIEQFKKGMDPDSATMVAERLKTLEEENGKLREKVSELELRPNTDELHERLAQVEGERDTHAARADALEAASKEAPKRVTQKDSGPKARTLKPIHDLVDMSKEDRDEFHADLLEKVKKADTVEIAFSDGKKELLDLGTHAVEGTVWKRGLHGLTLTMPVDLRGGGTSVNSVEGYALLLDGKPAAFTRMDTPVQVHPGSHVRLDDIHF